MPFILRAGKALNERKAEIRVQLRSTPHFVFEGDRETMRNEVVVRLQPDEAIYMKLICKKPGERRGVGVGGVMRAAWISCTLCTEVKAAPCGLRSASPLR